MARSQLQEPRFLCETCGYELAHDAADGEVCPECGRPVADSLGRVRVGSPWQQRPSVESYVASWVGVLTSPGQLLSVLSPGSTRHLLLAHTLVASGVAFLCALVALGPDVLRGRVTVWSIWFDGFGGLRGSALIGIAIITSVVSLLIPLLSVIEAIGLRIIAWQRRWRFGKGYSSAIVAHGAAGWVTGVMLGGPLLATAALAYDSLDWIGISYRASHKFAIAGAVAMVAGLLLFEMFAWRGLRRCRFANSPPDVR